MPFQTDLHEVSICIYCIIENFFVNSNYLSTWLHIYSNHSSQIFYNWVGLQGSPSGSNRIREEIVQSLFPVFTDTQTDCTVWFDPCSVWDTRLFISCICLVQWNSKTAKNWEPSEKLKSLMRWGLAAARPLFHMHASSLPDLIATFSKFVRYWDSWFNPLYQYICKSFLAQSLIFICCHIVSFGQIMKAAL